MRAQPDTMTMTPGTAKHCWPSYVGQASLIVQSSYWTPDDRIRGRLSTPSDAVRLGADALAVSISFRGDGVGIRHTAYVINTAYVERVLGADPVTSRITVTAGGERYIAFDDAPLGLTPPPSDGIVGQALDDAEALLIDAVVAPRDRGVPVILDAERDPSPIVRDRADAADHLVIPAASEPC